MDPKGRDASLLAKKLKEHIAESQSRKQKEGRKRSTVNWQRTGRGLAEEDQHLAPDRNERLLIGESRKQKEGRKRSKIAGKEQEADAVAKEAEQEQEQEQVEVHSKKIESSPAKNQKGKKKMGRPSKNEERSNKVKFYRNR